MLQEIVIKSNAEEPIKPLVESAIRNQLKSLQHGIKRTKERIAGFEEKAGMSSADFEKKLSVDSLEETLETIDWNMEITALRQLDGHYQSLTDIKIQ